MPGMGKGPLALCGMGLVYSMAQVYRLRSVPAWNSNRTLLAFAGSAVLLGVLGLNAIAFFTKAGSIGRLPLLLIAAITLLAMLPVTLPVTFVHKEQAHQTACRLRLGLIVLGWVGLLVMFFTQVTASPWIALPILMILLVEEGIGRWLFYEHLHQRNL
jgi:DMSO reductase anchor subunit